MRFLTILGVAVLALQITGCYTIDEGYGGDPYGRVQEREHGAVAAIQQHSQAVHTVTSPGLIPLGSSCDMLDYGVDYVATNGRYNVQSYGGQKCKGGPISRAGVVRAPGPAGASYEECKEINFSIPECGKYRRQQ